MKTPRILIVDDSREFRRLLRGNLALWDGIDVVGEASDGEEALRKVDELHPDLVLMDIEMKGMDGLECTERLKFTDPRMKIILLTIFGDRELRRRARKCRADAYFLKDNSIEELVLAIKDLVGGNDS